MDGEMKTNGVTEPEILNKKATDVETNGPNKDSQKPRKKRSRSRTPQKKSDDAKNVSLKKKVDDKHKVIEEKEETKEEDSTRNMRSKSQKEKDETAKPEHDTKDDKSKKDSSKKEETLKKDSPKKEKTSQKEVTPKKDSSSDSKVESSTSKKEATSKKDTTPPKKEIPSRKETTPTPKKDITLKKESTPTPKKGDTSKKDNTPKKDKSEKCNQAKESNGVDSDSIEMDPLLLPDEPEPELLFDENSDMESGKGSPIISRCITRRSLTRNIPTPKTPKSVDTDVDSEKASTTTEAEPLSVNNDLDDTNDLDSTNTSVKAEVGSDVTRLEYTEMESITGHDNSYFDISRERSLTETLRCLSARKPIRASSDIRTRVLRSAQERSDLNMAYSTDEQLRSSIKRKGRSTTPDGIKKFKVSSDSTSINSVFSSPIASLRSRFSRVDVTSSTPKLLGYKDNTNDLHYPGEYENVHGDDEKKSWCSVM